MTVETSMPTVFQTSVMRSALWAAAGDAMGWITELTNQSGLRHRTGLNAINKPVSWRRMIGGRSGVSVELPAGTYSDDTQLRLAVCRSIRGDGAFDAEAFAKVELPVWVSYALGGGRGTKAAAGNLARRDTNWFSNFFDGQGQSYFRGGGNGAAMRIQPHVWCSDPKTRRQYLPNVIKDAIVTHGHPHGFGGAALHAMLLGATVGRQGTPSVDDFYRCIENLKEIGDAIKQDQQLDGFWRPAWEAETGSTLSNAIQSFQIEAKKDLDLLIPIVETRDISNYGKVLDLLDCRDPLFRGSGLKTTLAAAALLQLSNEINIQDALSVCVNDLESDTDTIATMFAAMRGFTEASDPDWVVQDKAYIADEACRLAKIAEGQISDSFTYPDLAKWEPPSNQSEAVGRSGDGVALSGLGLIVLYDRKYSLGDAIWQWCRLPFGQSILVKRREKLKEISAKQIPASSRRQVSTRSAPKTVIGRAEQEQLTLVDQTSYKKKPPKYNKIGTPQPFELSSLARRVVASKFDPQVIGEQMLLCLNSAKPVENAVAFASLISWAASESNQ